MMQLYFTVALATVLAVLSAIDMRQQRLPDWLTLPLGAIDSQSAVGQPGPNRHQFPH